MNRTKPFLYFENDSQNLDNSEELIELIWSLGYKIFWHKTPMYNKNNFFKNENNVFGNMGSCNMIGISKDKKINIDLPEVIDSYFHPFRK